MNELPKAEELLDALDSLVWYNGAYEILEDVQRYIKSHIDGKVITYPYSLLAGEDKQTSKTVWFLMVCMFGDYGTSPRGGWIEAKNKDKAIAFLNAIMRTYVESEEV